MRVCTLLGVLPLLYISILSGCVRRGTHEVLVAELAQARSDQDRLAGEMPTDLQRRDNLIRARETEIVRL